MPAPTETTARRVSGEGVGGVQVFDIEGEGAAVFLDTHFVAGSHWGTGGLVFGRLIDGDEVIDECLLIRSDSSARIMLHGGRAIEERMRRLSCESGLRLLQPGAMESACSAVEHEAEVALQNSRSVQTVLFLAAAMEGSLVREVEGVRRFLVAEPSQHVAPAASRLESLIQRAPFGCALLDPPSIGVFGCPNVGKSTLFNSLLGHERALVHEDPGTTRDSVEAPCEWEGFPFRLIDTAGQREGESEVEREGIRRSGVLRSSVDLGLLLFDCPDEVPDSIPPGAIIVLNKIDRLSDDDLAELRRAHPEWVFTSAQDHVGLAELRQRVVFRSVFSGPAVREMPCPFTARQTAVLTTARQHLPMDREAAVDELARFNEPISME